MADKKATKQAAEVKTLEQLHKELANTETLRGHRAGELQNVRVLGKTRKEIARLLTAINAAEQEEGEK